MDCYTVNGLKLGVFLRPFKFVGLRVLCAFVVKKLTTENTEGTKVHKE